MLRSGHGYPSAYPSCVPRNTPYVHGLLIFFTNISPQWSIPSAPPGSPREPPWVPGAHKRSGRGEPPPRPEVSGPSKPRAAPIQVDVTTPFKVLAHRLALSAR